MLGQIEQHRGQMEEALRHFEEAKELYEVVEDRHGQANCTRSIGKVELHRGQTDKALSRFEEAKALYLLERDLGAQLNCLFNISEVYTGDAKSRGTFKAIRVLEEAVNLSKAAGGYCEARSRDNLAKLLLQSSQYPVAREEVGRARQLYADCFATSDVDDCDNLLQMIGQAETRLWWKWLWIVTFCIVLSFDIEKWRTY
ncbi:hypothetical protein BT69DRAFT_876285 [Atractiella rhizophila]|nr:hypothetical protein BT69DRAFT_876285 [Atractiella rhizophila]